MRDGEYSTAVSSGNPLESVVGAQLAVDVGGTFTDVILVSPDGSAETMKLLSSPPDFGRAVIEGVRSVMARSGLTAKQLHAVLHGTTVATNALLEEKGSTPALVTTAGFRDVLEFARGRRPTLYDPLWNKPKPLVPRRLRYEVAQRITADGELDPAFDAAEVRRMSRVLRASGVVSVAVCLVNSYVRPDEERRLVNALRAECPDLSFTASVDLTMEIGEYERASTAVVNAYVMPAVDAYLRALEHNFTRLGLRAPFYVMQSNGGLLRSSAARARPVNLIESGPAAGVSATAFVCRRMGVENAIGFDMGGTTAKASLIDRGSAVEVAEYEVAAGMNASRGMNLGAGYPIRASSLDVAEIGAGGGSIFWVDSAGSPHVGPQSAGADPGPACYGRGAKSPTLSDASLLLGYLNPRAIAGGAQRLSKELAEAAIAPIAAALHLENIEAAHGAFRIGVTNMTRLLRAVTSARGRDPREFTLVAFGGAGPIFGAELARELGIEHVIVPAAPGLFSAVGLLVSDAMHDDVRSYSHAPLDLADIDANFGTMEAEMLALLKRDGYPRDDISLERFVDMRYSGQRGLSRIPYSAAARASVDRLIDCLEEEHYRVYRHRKVRTAAEVARLRLKAVCRRTSLDPLAAISSRQIRTTSSVTGRRDAYFGARIGSLSTPILARSDIGILSQEGPLIVEDPDSTTVVPPAARIRRDGLNNLHIETGGWAARWCQ